MTRHVDLGRLEREIAAEIAERERLGDCRSHVLAYERQLLKRYGFVPYGRHGWWRRRGSLASMTDDEAISRIRAGQYEEAEK